MKLSVKQIEALRSLDPSDPQRGEVHHRTLANLKARQLVFSDNTLTPDGEYAVRSYRNRTGDGPEGLKRLLSF